MKKEREIYSALTDNLILKFLTFFNLNCRYLVNIFQAEPEFSHGHVLMQQVTIIWQVKSLFSQQYLHSTFSILCFIFLFLSSAIRNLVKSVLFLYSMCSRKLHQAIWPQLPHVMSDSWWSHGLVPTRLLCPWNYPGKNTGVGSHALLQGIFPAQGLNLGLLHCR